MHPHARGIDVSDAGQVVGLTFLGETDEGLEDGLDAVLGAREVDDDFDVLRLDGFEPGEGG